MAGRLHGHVDADGVQALRDVVGVRVQEGQLQQLALLWQVACGVFGLAPVANTR